MVAGYFWIHPDFQSDRNPQIINKGEERKCLSSPTSIGHLRTSKMQMRARARVCMRVCSRETTNSKKKNLSIPLRQRRESAVQRSSSLERLFRARKSLREDEDYRRVERRRINTLKAPSQISRPLPRESGREAAPDAGHQPAEVAEDRAGLYRTILTTRCQTAATANTRQNDTVPPPRPASWSRYHASSPSRFHRAIPPPTRKGENTLSHFDRDAARTRRVFATGERRGATRVYL